jgi:hypothetical protein
MIISQEHIWTLRNKVASLKSCRNSFICEREAFVSLIFRLLAFRFLASPSLQNRLKETSLCDGNTLIGQSILPTNESGLITQACLFQSILQTGSSENPEDNSLKIERQQSED